MTKLERAIGDKIEVTTWGNGYAVMLHSGCQSFTVMPEYQTKPDAQWMRRMLRKALVNLVNEVKP